ncbi:hypothetical protein COEREDRAFT_10399 [Coemansia reversa NRRL 1564]|uniref:Uncharacterized protein n=1 Tax=Coemansia reversa (strain ATCC 12441 / NRRL 1564) TaxID=763665 RepID=A0A2G5B5T2_COERN|nr:hypothetical protein COEREDRAFT_10399 [Coemansia reversa NRRL 1564]|eukprot:PIA14354.1 hypothetical protein COEREDRAFT_10399 [Coemansia reversa NRRL 1564]
MSAEQPNVNIERQNDTAPMPVAPSNRNRLPPPASDNILYTELEEQNNDLRCTFQTCIPADEAFKNIISAEAQVSDSCLNGGSIKRRLCESDDSSSENGSPSKKRRTDSSGSVRIACAFTKQPGPIKTINCSRDSLGLNVSAKKRHVNYVKSAFRPISSTPIFSRTYQSLEANSTYRDMRSSTEQNVEAGASPTVNTNYATLIRR